MTIAPPAPARTLPPELALVAEAHAVTTCGLKRGDRVTWRGCGPAPGRVGVVTGLWYGYAHGSVLARVHWRGRRAAGGSTDDVVVEVGDLERWRWWR